MCNEKTDDGLTFREGKLPVSTCGFLRQVVLANDLKPSHRRRLDIVSPSLGGHELQEIPILRVTSIIQINPALHITLDSPQVKDSA